VGGRAQVFQLLAGENISSVKMDLGVTVLSGLRGGHIGNLAGTLVDHSISSLLDGRRLKRAGVSSKTKQKKKKKKKKNGKK
jgi:hypothetical protein